MIYTAIIECFATQSRSYQQIIRFDAQSIQELKDLFDILEVCDDMTTADPRITVDDSKKPSRFDESGGFADKLISLKDQNGVDYSYLNTVFC